RHWPRDVVLGEDACRVRTGNTPHVLGGRAQRCGGTAASPPCPQTGRCRADLRLVTGWYGARPAPSRSSLIFESCAGSFGTPPGMKMGANKRGGHMVGEEGTKPSSHGRPGSGAPEFA